MTATDRTVEEQTSELTGRDENAIRERFGFDLYHAAETRPGMMIRALVFAHLRSTGLDDAAAYDRVLDMPVREVNDYFAPDTEANPDDPDTPSGKGSPQPAPELSGSPLSASPLE